MRPTLLNSCARAATAAEVRFRIDAVEGIARSSRVIALDEGAASFVRGLAGQRWHGGHFLVFDHLVTANLYGSGPPADAMLRDVGGAGTLLSTELDGADVAVMIATSAASAGAASVIGDACALRSIMSAGLVLDAAAEPGTFRSAVPALRPNAMVLVVLKESDDIAEILAALRV
jgi:hypothetical protein